MEAAIRQQFEGLASTLDERQRRLWAAAEAKAWGYGGVSLVSRSTGISRRAIHVGLRELQAEPTTALEGGKPLTSHEVVVQLIAKTTTETGLRVRAALDKNSYPTGIKVTDDELASVNLRPAKFHGEWNYTIKPSG